MIGLGKVVYYNEDGTMDWLRTIVRTVYTFIGNHDAYFVVSIAAKRAQRLYYRKTDIRTLFAHSDNIIQEYGGTYNE